MQSGYDEIAKLGAEVLAISVDSPEKNLGVVRKAELDYPILSDADGTMMDAFGVRHVGASMDGGDIARPAVFVIDTKGDIAWRKITDSYRVRVRPETVIEALKKTQ